MSLTQAQKDIITATVPIVQQHGLTVTQYFYKHLLEEHSELKHLFSHSAQITSHQASALAASLYAYAANINDLSPILPIVERIAQKHASVNIKPEQYPLVGNGLLAAFKEVLGDAFTDDIRDAWAAAYGQLAQIFIGREESIYSEHEHLSGGWRGFREMKIIKKVIESSEVTSFYLQATDGKQLPTFKPGQYISVRIEVPALGFKQIRQYSLSDAPPAVPGIADGTMTPPPEHSFRFSVKKDAGIDLADENAKHHPGYVSNLLHEHFTEGMTIEATHPAGEFVLDLHGDTSCPVVLISGGVGITPVMSMLKTLASETENDRPISWLHVAKDKDRDAFVNEIKAVTADHQNVRSKVFHSRPTSEEHEGEDFDLKGRLNLSQVQDLLHLDNKATQYYTCGGNSFMADNAKFLHEQGVEKQRIHLEVFGSGGYELGA